MVQRERPLSSIHDIPEHLPPLPLVISSTLREYGYDIVITDHIEDVHVVFAQERRLSGLETCKTILEYLLPDGVRRLAHDEQVTWWDHLFPYRRVTNILDRLVQQEIPVAAATRLVDDPRITESIVYLQGKVDF